MCGDAGYAAVVLAASRRIRLVVRISRFHDRIEQGRLGRHRLASEQPIVDYVRECQYDAGAWHIMLILQDVTDAIHNCVEGTGLIVGNWFSDAVAMIPVIGGR
jgi:hypothetical protein